MNASPFALARMPRPQIRGVRGTEALTTTTTTQLPGGSLLDIVTNRWVYDLRWNPILNKWVSKEYENATSIPGTVQLPSGKNIPTWVMVGGAAALLAGIWFLTRKSR